MFHYNWHSDCHQFVTRWTASPFLSLFTLSVLCWSYLFATVVCSHIVHRMQYDQPSEQQPLAFMHINSSNILIRSYLSTTKQKTRKHSESTYHTSITHTTTVTAHFTMVMGYSFLYLKVENLRCLWPLTSEQKNDNYSSDSVLKYLIVRCTAAHWTIS